MKLKAIQFSWHVTKVYPKMNLFRFIEKFFYYSTQNCRYQNLAGSHPVFAIINDCFRCQHVTFPMRDIWGENRTTLDLLLTKDRIDQ